VNIRVQNRERSEDHRVSYLSTRDQEEVRNTRTKVAGEQGT